MNQFQILIYFIWKDKIIFKLLKVVPFEERLKVFTNVAM